MMMIDRKYMGPWHFLFFCNRHYIFIGTKQKNAFHPRGEVILGRGEILLVPILKERFSLMVFHSSECWHRTHCVGLSCPFELALAVKGLCGALSSPAPLQCLWIQFCHHSRFSDYFLPQRWWLSQQREVVQRVCNHSWHPFWRSSWDRWAQDSVKYAHSLKKKWMNLTRTFRPPKTVPS